MFKSQKQTKILLYFFFTFFLTICKPAFCENYNFQLQHADSLFRAKKFTQAFKIYESLHESGASTPSMYLKMAYIKEGLGDISNAMFFLNQYYYSTFNKQALKKMENMAEEHHLSGYEYADFQFFQNLILKNALWINLAMIMICALLLGVIIYRSRYAKTNFRTPAIVLSTFICFFLLFNNIHIIPEYAIVKADNAIVMRDPSAAANPVSSIKKGNKIKVLGTSKVWVKVEYKDQVGYIRDHNLIMMPGERIY